MIIATAGHVDHGKTALVRALTGVDTDRLPQEQSRGMSIELGFAFRPTGTQGMLGFIDVPGHERLVHTMVGGVSGIHHALLVVAADDGPMPQTLEHLAILDLLGLSSATLVITKTDRADAARVAQVEADMQVLLAASSIGSVPTFLVCALTGEGIENLWDHLVALATALRGDRPLRAGGFRMAIDRCFTMAGAGCIVTGTVHAGSVRVGETLAIAPGGDAVRVRGLRVQGVDAQEAAAGVRCALNIDGPDVNKSRIARGDWVVAPDIAVGTDRIDVQLRMLTGHQPLRSGSRVHVHLAAAACTARVVVLQGPGNRSVAWDDCVNDDEYLVQLVLDRPIGARWGDRLLLRDWSARHTLAGGAVLDPLPVARGRGRDRRLAVLGAQQRVDPVDALRALVDVEADGVDIDAFFSARNVPRGERGVVLQAVDSIVINHRGRSRAFASARWDELRRLILEIVEQSHVREPTTWGPTESTLRKVLGSEHTSTAVEACVQSLVNRMELSRVQAFLRRPCHSPKIEARDLPLWKDIRGLLLAQAPCPASIPKLAGETGVPVTLIDDLMRRVSRLGLVIGLADRRYLLAESVDVLEQVVHQVASSSADGAFTVAAFRDSAGIGRKFCINVLEHFDRCGVTRRLGERRWLVDRQGVREGRSQMADDNVCSAML